MLEFIQKYKLLFFGALPVWVMAGMVFKPLNFIFLAIYLVYFYIEKRNDYILMAMFIILLLGDSRQPIFQFAKPLRIEMITMMALFTINDLRKGIYKINLQFLYFLPFFFIGMVSLIHSPDTGTGLFKTFSYALLLFNSFHYINYQVGYYGRALSNDVVMLAAWVLLIGLLLIPISPEFCFYLGSLRFNGIIGNPNGMGIFTTLLFPLVVFHFENYDKDKKRFQAFVYFLIIISLLLCSSRNAIFSVTLFVSLYYALHGGLLRKLAIFGGLFPIILILMFTVDLEGLIIKAGLEGYFRLKDFESGSGRTHAWAYALEIIENNPLLGCGFYCEEYKFRFEPSHYLISTGHQGGVHNSYLAFLVNVGAIGLTLFLAAWTMVLTKIKEFKFLLPFALSVAFSAVFESWMIASLNAFNIYFVFTALMVISDQRYRLFKLE